MNQEPRKTTYKPLFLRLPAGYHEALSRLAGRSRRTLVEEAKIAFEEHFVRQGVWPAQEAGGGS